MTRILVPRGAANSSSSASGRLSLLGSSSSTSSPQSQSSSTEQERHVQDSGVIDSVLDEKTPRNEDSPVVNAQNIKNEIVRTDSNQGFENNNIVELGQLRLQERYKAEENEGSNVGSSNISAGSSYPPPPPVPPPRPLATITSSSSRRITVGSSMAPRIGSPRRTSGWNFVSTRTSPSGSRPPSPGSYSDADGYNSADEQHSCFGASYDNDEREQQFEIDIRRTKGLEVKRMGEDGNCLFRAIADQVYGDSEAYDLTRQMCIDYMERERDHFSQFITEGFISYCKRKRRDKVYGNNVEIQALSEMYNRPIHIYSYSTEPINIFHGSYNTDTPPIRLSYHHGNHYNSLVDPRRLTVGAGLGFSCLRGRNIDKDQVKAAIKAQQDQQIDNALLAEGRFYSDIELTEKEIERMVMEASRAEYVVQGKLIQQHNFRESSTSSAEPSSSGATTGISRKESKLDSARERSQSESTLSNSMQIALSMGFSYLQVIEAFSIFGDDLDSIVCYLIETSGSNTPHNPNRCKGKAAE